jgi:hypothetical protein
MTLDRETKALRRRSSSLSLPHPQPLSLACQGFLLTERKQIYREKKHENLKHLNK